MLFPKLLKVSLVSVNMLIIPRPNAASLSVKTSTTAPKTAIPFANWFCPSSVLVNAWANEVTNITNAPRPVAIIAPFIVLKPVIIPVTPFLPALNPDTRPPVILSPAFSMPDISVLVSFKSLLRFPTFFSDDLVSTNNWTSIFSAILFLV